MTVSEAILTLNVNAVIACERAGFDSATVKMVEDALDTIEDTLKAQEPRLMTLEEIVKWDGAFYLEFLEDDNENYTRHGYAFFSGSTPYVVEIIARDSFRPLYAFIKCEYGKRWRCWTSRPDDATREATPWERSTIV